MRFSVLRAIVSTGIVTVLFFFPVSGEVPGEPGKKHELSGYAAYENGQIVKGKYGKISEDLNLQWIGRVYGNFADEISINDHLRAVFGVEFRVWYNSSPINYNTDDGIFPDQHYDIYLTNAEGVYSIGRPERPLLDIRVGLFPVKYNPDSRNLGEYLFRTGTYPAYIFTSFDLPLERVIGLNLHSGAIEGLRLDVFATTMRKIRPYYDYSFTGLAQYSVGSLLDFGAAVQFANLLSVDGRETTPVDEKNMYYTGVPSAGKPSDSGRYTFRGTKLMGHFSFDIKALFPAVDIFGNDDLKIYGEAAILGLENYPASNRFDSAGVPHNAASSKSNVYGYDTLLHKMPVMMGVNLPCFKILDLFSVEAEWYGCTYPNNFHINTKEGMPFPDVPPNGYSPGDYLHDNWKWSVYLKKSVSNGFCLILQFARDHMRLDTFTKKDIDREEALVRPGHWYWMFKTKYEF